MRVRWQLITVGILVVQTPRVRSTPNSQKQEQVGEEREKTVASGHSLKISLARQTSARSRAHYVNKMWAMRKYTLVPRS